MSTSITLTNIEEMKHSDVVMALEFIAKKIGFDQPKQEAEPDSNTTTETQPEIPSFTNAPGAAGIDVDTSGLPWDGRIHASTRSKTVDGNWKMRRGVDDDIVSAVLNELRQTMGLAPTEVVPPSPLTPPPSQVFAQPAAQVPPPPFAPPVAPPAPPMATLPTEIPQVGTATGASPSEQITFPKLMQKITAAFAAKTLDQAAIGAAVQAAGLPSLPMLASRPDLVPVVATALGLAL